MSSPISNTAESFYKRYDVMNAAGYAGPDGEVSHTEMNRAEVATALQQLPDPDFARVWDKLSDGAKWKYFHLNYPDLPGSWSQIVVWEVNTDAERAAIVRMITDRRDLKNFAKLPNLLTAGTDYDTVIGMWVYKKHERALRAEIKRVIAPGTVSPGGPTLQTPDRQ